MCNYIYLFLFFASAFLFAQNTFEKSYGGDLDEEGFAVVQTYDNGFIIAGSTKSYGLGNSDVYIIRTNAFGDTLWTKTFGTTQYDAASDIIKTSDSLYLIACYTDGFTSDGDVWLIKMNADGDTLWTKVLGTIYNDHVSKVIETSDGGFMVCGDYEHYGKYWMRMLKTNESGDTLWTKSYYYGIGNWVDQTSDGGYVVMIYPYNSSQYRYDFELIRTSQDGDSIWGRFYGGSDMEIGYAVEETNDGGFVLAGRSNADGSGSDDFYMLKINGAGDSLWSKTYGGDGIDRAFTLTRTSDGGFILGGMTASFNVGFFDFYIVKTDSSGDTLWTRTYGGINQEENFDIEETSDGGFAAVGYTYSFGAGSFSNIYLVKTNSQGLLSDNRDVQQAPLYFEISQNYPNPFNPATTIKYNISCPSKVIIKVYDVLGNEISVLENGLKNSGSHELTWDGSDFPSGVYFYKISTGEFSQIKKMILLK